MAKPNSQTHAFTTHQLLPGGDKYGCQPDGEDIIMSYRIPSDVVKRLKMKANGIPLDRYIYENIAYRHTVDWAF